MYAIRCRYLFNFYHNVIIVIKLHVQLSIDKLCKVFFFFLTIFSQKMCYEYTNIVKEIIMRVI